MEVAQPGLGIIPIAYEALALDWRQRIDGGLHLLTIGIIGRDAVGGAGIVCDGADRAQVVAVEEAQDATDLLDVGGEVIDERAGWIALDVIT